MNVFDPCEDWLNIIPAPLVATGRTDQLIDNADGTVAALFSGSITPNNTPAEGYFEYWLIDEPPPRTILQTPSQSIGSGQSPVNVFAVVENLTADTEYAFRMVADNGLEVVNGETVEFNTHLAYIDDLEDDDHCKGFSPCWEPYIQEAVEASVAGATIRILHGDYLENSASCIHANVYVEQGVILHLGLDEDYLSPAGAPSVIRAGSPDEATLTIVNGTLIPWRAVIR